MIIIIAVAAPLVSIDISSQNFHVIAFGKVYKSWNDNIQCESKKIPPPWGVLAFFIFSQTVENF